VLVIGGTGRIGRAVTLELLRTGVPVRVLTRRPSAAGLPSLVHIVGGDLTLPESLGPSLRDVRSVFLIWTAPPAGVQAGVERLALSATHVVFLSSPHQTPHPFVRQPNPMATLHAEIERALVASGVASTILRPPECHFVRSAVISSDKGSISRSARSAHRRPASLAQVHVARHSLIVDGAVRLEKTLRRNRTACPSVLAGRQPNTFGGLPALGES
jgi:uncharacterized protein YbjT (DUF2867 family)